MKFSEIANRLTGISTPLGGVSWQSSDLEVSAARRVIAFLAASQRENFRHSTPERVHVCILRFAEVNLLQTKDLVRVALANVNDRPRIENGTEYGEASAIKGPPRQAAHGWSLSHFPRRLYGPRQTRPASPLRSDR